MDGGCKASGFLKTRWMRRTATSAGCPSLVSRPRGGQKSRVAGLPEFIVDAEAACARRLESHRADPTLYEASRADTS